MVGRYVCRQYSRVSSEGVRQLAGSSGIAAVSPMGRTQRGIVSTKTCNEQHASGSNSVQATAAETGDCSAYKHVENSPVLSTHLTCFLREMVRQTRWERCMGKNSDKSQRDISCCNGDISSYC